MIFGVALLMEPGGYPPLPRPMPPPGATGVAVSGPVARQQDTQREGIVLEDGTWVDVGSDGRWQHSPGARTRADVLLGGVLGVLVILALVTSVGGTDDAEPERAL